MKKLFLLALLVCAIFTVGSVIAHAELTPPINGEGDDAVVGVATDEDAGDSSVVDLSDVDTTQPVKSPSFENTTPAGMAPGGPIED